MITIITTQVINDDEGNPQCRHCDIVIDNDNSQAYTLGVGGLPLTGELQPILDARRDELWFIAVQKGILPDVTLTTTQEGKQWFKAHPNAILLFELSMEEIDEKVAAWDLSSIPNPVRNEIKLTIRALIASVRILAHQLDLID